jgi:hypothetical protein
MANCKPPEKLRSGRPSGLHAFGLPEQFIWNFYGGLHFMLLIYILPYLWAEDGVKL